MVAARAKRTRAPRRCPRTERTSATAIRAIISVSLWEDEIALNRASGLSTPSQSATAGLTPKWRASAGRQIMSATTPIDPSRRKAITWAMSDGPAIATVSRVSITKRGP